MCCRLKVKFEIIDDLILASNGDVKKLDEIVKGEEKEEEDEKKEKYR